MLLGFEGFENGVGGESGATHDQWSNSLVANRVSSQVRSGVGACEVDNGGFLTTKVLAPSGGGWSTHSIRYPSTPSAAGLVFQVREGTTIHLSLEINATQNGLVLKRGQAGTTLATGSLTFPVGGYWVLDITWTIDDSTGSCSWTIDGSADGSCSSADTKNGGTGAWDRLRYWSPVFDGRVDDIAYGDTSGGAPYNTYLGSRMRVETLLAQAGNGANTGLTPSTGSDHGALVDDARNAPNSDTDYNASANVGDKDTYTMSNMTLTGTILAIQTGVVCKKTDAVARTVCPVVRHSGTDYDGTSVPPLTSYGQVRQIYIQNPGTSAAFASVSEVNALEIGMKVTA